MFSSTSSTTSNEYVCGKQRSRLDLVSSPSKEHDTGDDHADSYLAMPDNLTDAWTLACSARFPLQFDDCCKSQALGFLLRLLHQFLTPTVV